MLTDLEYIMLGILSFGPTTGYEIRRVVEQSPVIGFSSSAGAIYPAIKRLEHGGYLKSQLEIQELRPNKKVLSLTDEGRNALRTWLKCPLTDKDYEKVHDPLMAKVLFFHNLSMEESRQYLVNQANMIEEYILELERTLENCKGMGFYQSLCMESGIVHLRTQLNWLRDTLTKLDQHVTSETAQGCC